MKTLKKVIRAILLIFLIILAASGMFISFIPTTRERYLDKEIRIEQVDKKDAEDETNDDQE